MGNNFPQESGSAESLRLQTMQNENKVVDTPSANELNDRKAEKANDKQLELPKFSFFKRPISNLIPYKDIDLLQLYEIIQKSKYYKKNTITANVLHIEYLKTGNKKLYDKFKKMNFDYCTPSGSFTKRDGEFLTKHSGYLRIDFDNVPDIIKLKNDLLNDDRIETDLLFFTPSAHGIAWFVSIEPNKDLQEEYYVKIGRYIINRYKLPEKCLDLSCKDVGRATFICHDAEVYINPKYLNL